jgi:UPF0716 protein FxsA
VRLLLILFFVGVPIAEIAVFIQAGEIIGLWPTLAAIVATAVIGAALLRAQGLATLERARRQVDQGRLPVREVFTGVCLLLAGALLLTPGFLTDTVGFLLLVPPVRQAIGAWIAKVFFRSPNSRVWVDGEEVSGAGRNAGRPPGGVIDADYTVVEDPDDRDPGDDPPRG